MNSCMRPGGLEITKKAFDSSGLPKGAKVLDVGCGNGDTAAYLEKEYGLCVTGIDISAEAVAQAKEKHQGIEFAEGDGEFLEFPSHAFDCVLMGCVLSLIPNPVEAVHEAFCVLKDGGVFIIHDVYLPNPSAEDFETLRKIKELKKNEMREDGSCSEERVSDCTVNGALVLNDIRAALVEIGFETLLFEDRKSDLDSFAASVIFERGQSADISAFTRGGTKPSYFLLVARKGQKI